MVNFEDDFFTAMVQEDIQPQRKSSRSSNSRQVDDGFGGGGDCFNSSGDEATSRRPRTNNAISSSSNSSSSRRRPPSNSASGQSLDEMVGHRSGPSRSTERSVASAGNSRRPGRRASVSHGSSTSSSTRRPVSRQESSGEESGNVDYGYGDIGSGGSGHRPSSSAEEDYGYGDPEPQQAEQQPVVRARRQRRCSIADVVSAPAATNTIGDFQNTASVDYGYGDDAPDTDAAPASRGLLHSASVRKTGINSSMANLAIPMAMREEPKKAGGMGRRGSIAMLTGMGRSNKKEEKVPDVAAKKPSADRDRHRQGTLMDRVGASGASNSRSGASSSYSDRIMSK